MRTARTNSRLFGGVCLSACWGTPLGVGLQTPLGVGLETPLVLGLETPPGVGLETPQARPLNFPPWVWAWKPARHAGIPPPPPDTCKACWDTTCNACWDTLPPRQNSWHTLLKILPCPKLRLQAVKIEKNILYPWNVNSFSGDQRRRLHIKQKWLHFTWKWI